MDPLSVAASIVAVVGAAATVARELEKLRRTLKDASNTLCSLVNEVSDLQLVISACESAVEDLAQYNGDCSAPLSTATSVLERAKRDLFELGSLVSSCLKPSSSGAGVQQVRVARVRWLKASAAAEKLQTRLRDSKQEILMLLGANSVSTISRMRLSIEGISVGAQQFQSETSDKLDVVIAGLSHQAMFLEQTKASTPSLTTESRINELSTTGEVTELLNHPSDNYRGIVPLEQKTGGVSILTSCYRNSCRPWCSCRCHVKRSLRSPSNQMIKTFIRSLFVGYGGIPGMTPTCNEAMCKKRSTARLVLSYQFPAWFWTKNLFASFVANTLAGPELLLRVQNTIPWESRACQYCVIGEVMSLKRMFENGMASPFDVQQDSFSLLLLALQHHRYDVCRLLISYGVDIYQESYKGISAFDYGWDIILSNPWMRKGKRALMELFPPREGDLDEREFSRIHKCVLGLIDTDLSVELDISTSVINDVDNMGQTPLYWAAVLGDLDAVSLLLKFNADPNRAGHLGQIDKLIDRPLHAASAVGNASIVCLLVSCLEVDVNQRGYFEATPLFDAASINDGNACIDVLLDAGANVDARDSADATPFMRAIERGLRLNADMLLKRGADIDSTDIGGWTGLQSCVFWNSYKSVPWLLRRGAAYSTLTNNGETLLHIAATFADLWMLDTLQHCELHGLPVDAKTKAGQTAQDIADSRTEEDQDWHDAFADLLLSIEGNEVTTEASDDFEGNVGGNGVRGQSADGKVLMRITEVTSEDSGDADVFHDALETV